MPHLAPRRPFRLPVLGTALVLLTLTLSTSASARRAHDQNLSDADNSVQKALALLEAVQTPTGPPRAVRRFEVHVQIAELALRVARQQMQAAIDVQESITGP